HLIMHYNCVHADDDLHTRATRLRQLFVNMNQIEDRTVCQVAEAGADIPEHQLAPIDVSSLRNYVTSVNAGRYRKLLMKKWPVDDWEGDGWVAFLTGKHANDDLVIYNGSTSQVPLSTITTYLSKNLLPRIGRPLGGWRAREFEDVQGLRRSAIP